MDCARQVLALHADESLAMPPDELEERVNAWLTGLLGSVDRRLAGNEMIAWASMLLPGDDQAYATTQLLGQVLEALRSYPVGGVCVVRDHLESLQARYPDPEDAWRVGQGMQEVFGALRLANSNQVVIPCPNGDWLVVSQHGVQQISDRALRRLS